MAVFEFHFELSFYLYLLFSFGLKGEAYPCALSLKDIVNMKTIYVVSLTHAVVLTTEIYLSNQFTVYYKISIKIESVYIMPPMCYVS